MVYTKGKVLIICTLSIKYLESCAYDRTHGVSDENTGPGSKAALRCSSVIIIHGVSSMGAAFRGEAGTHTKATTESDTGFADPGWMKQMRDSSPSTSLRVRMTKREGGATTKRTTEILSQMRLRMMSRDGAMAGRDAGLLRTRSGSGQDAEGLGAGEVAAFGEER